MENTSQEIVYQEMSASSIKKCGWFTRLNTLNQPIEYRLKSTLLGQNGLLEITGSNRAIRVMHLNEVNKRFMDYGSRK
ncbi:MAG: hypothetical protein V1915_03360 [Candidatus Bathyarchaeota archaeon]